MTQGIPGHQEDDSAVQQKGTGRRPVLGDGNFRKGLVFPEKPKFAQVHGSRLGHLHIPCRTCTALGSVQEVVILCCAANANLCTSTVHSVFQSKIPSDGYR